MSGSDSPTFFHGQPWSSWIERIGRDKPLSDEEPDAEPTSSVTRLSADDIDLYGFCPERDTFYGVVCEICNAIVKPQALIQHMESRHSSTASNLPPPSTPASKTTVKTPYCKVSKLTKKTQPSSQPSSTGSSSSGTNNGSNQSSSTKINHASIKRSAEQANVQPLLPTSSPRSPLESVPVSSANSSTTTGVPSSPVKSPGSNGNASGNSNNGSTNTQQRRKRLKADRGLLKDREYDPDRHCGVWNEETGKPCTRSLTCKAHTVSLRRTVIGRSKSFDKLLADHRAAKEFPNRTSKVTVTGTVTVSTASTGLGSTGSLGAEPDAPGSPPVLSLPDSYPLPKTKLEEDFVSEEMRLEASLSGPPTSSSSSTTPSSSAKSMMAPISVVLPSLSPISTNDSHVATLIPVTSTTSVASTPLPAPAAELPATVLEGETPGDVPDTKMGLFSPVSMFKDSKTSNIIQISRSNHLIQSPVSRSFQTQASMPSLVFDDQIDHPKQLANGTRFNNHNNLLLSPIGRPIKRSKHDFQPEFSKAIQVEATTTSTPYPHFSDIAWSNCHPEPLAVSRWLRITSSRKQYNFNIH
ncbi:ataxin-7-like protein 1 isoform X2 [Chelonus insularis]|uniref:ataxin-7-like protein 1 isoform X2 n=1 Tax=Chelonus insularis TaxID=460826 RepID=UPI00158A12D0|nr:ataxin-7-like protein 1 isoform X2 [Chelonus insularis]